MNINWGEFEVYLRYTKNPPLSDSSIVCYRRMFTRVNPYFVENGYSSTTLLAYVQLKKQEGLKNKSLNQYRKFFRHVDSYLKVNHSDVLRRLQDEDTDYDVITNEEKEAIVACEDHLEDSYKQKDQRLYSVLYLLLSELALRIDEALRLKWVSFKSDYITIHSTKTNRYDDLLITPRLKGELEALQRSSEYVFPFCQQSVNVDLKKRCAFLKINKRVSTHTFRRSFATVAIEEGIQRDFVQQRMRHRSSASLDKYIRKSKRHQREVLQRHPFTVDSMSQEDKVNYIRGKQRELEDEMRRLGVTGEMLSLYK